LITLLKRGEEKVKIRGAFSKSYRDDEFRPSCAGKEGKRR